MVILYAFIGNISRHENSSAIAYIIILCIVGIYRGCVVRYNNIRFWTETRSLGLHRCSCCIYTAIDSKRNNRVFTRFSSEKQRRRTARNTEK